MLLLFRRGLPTILQRWHGRGFGMDLQDLLAIIKRRTMTGPYSREYNVKIHFFEMTFDRLVLERELCSKSNSGIMAWSCSKETFEKSRSSNEEFSQ